MSLIPGEKEYWLPPHVRACSTASGTVLLDLRRNRYFGVGRKETQVLSSLAANWQSSPVSSGLTGEVDVLTLEDAVRIADKLVEAGLLSKDAPATAAFTPAAIDLNSLLTSVGHEVERRASIRWHHIAHFLRACAWARRSVRSRTLYVVAEEISRKKNAGTPFDAERAIELVGVFRRLRPHTFAARDRCLFHALALMRFLAAYEIYPTWVIGVRTRPWAAHSWVQQGTLLLDAKPEQVCDYSPILAI